MTYGVPSPATPAATVLLGAMIQLGLVPMLAAPPELQALLAS